MNLSAIALPPETAALVREAMVSGLCGFVDEAARALADLVVEQGIEQPGADVAADAAGEVELADAAGDTARPVDNRSHSAARDEDGAACEDVDAARDEGGAEAAAERAGDSGGKARRGRRGGRKHRPPGQR